MTLDFTLPVYIKLLEILQRERYTFNTFEFYQYKTDEKFVLLRHDVDRLPGNSLEFAKIQNKFGIKGSYYFRTVPQSFDEEIIKKIADLGHEIGYHYENLDHSQGDYEKAINDFESNLEKFRKIYPIKTICMHGSPLSRFDNRDIWKKYDYRDYGIIGEPYFDIDFDQVFYLTDTGRRWDGNHVSVRDKIGTEDRRPETGSRKWPSYQLKISLMLLQITLFLIR